jgi:hypothetical protein
MVYSQLLQLSNANGNIFYPFYYIFLAQEPYPLEGFFLKTLGHEGAINFISSFNVNAELCGT